MSVFDILRLEPGSKEEAKLYCVAEIFIEKTSFVVMTSKEKESNIELPSEYTVAA